jgi:hypothetical protein
VSVAGEEDEVGKSAADIDAEAARKISIHSLFITPTVFGLSLSDIARNMGPRHTCQPDHLTPLSDIPILDFSAQLTEGREECTDDDLIRFGDELGGMA